MALTRKNGDRGFLNRIAGGASEKVLNVVDPNQVLDHIDINALLDRVDINALLDRVDVDALLSRADIDALMERVDVKSLVDRAGIPEIVAESTSHLTGSALDLVRRPLVGLDLIFSKALNRLIGRDQSTFPEGPAELVAWVDEHVSDAQGVKTGRYAGPLTRLLATIIDFLIISFTFTLLVGLFDFAVDRFTNSSLEISGVWYGGLLALWGFIYLLIGTGLAGKTLGKALLGLRVVTASGNPDLRKGAPFLRVLTFPLSFILALGLFGIVWGRERRAWHDHFAGTAVVYDWGSRTATLPTPLTKYIERRAPE